MKSIRKFAYAVVLTLSALNFVPSLASAQDEAGRFTLPNEVHWQNVSVPPGDYKFTLKSGGPSEMLMLRKLSGTPQSFMLLVNDTDVADNSKAASLIINTRFGERYVSAMNLPQFELTLHFTPPANSGKEVAEMHTASGASSAK